MRTVLIVGIGAGDPDQVTLQAVRALNRADVFFVMDKGEAAGDLTRLRRALCERHVTHRRYRFVEVEDPVRAADLPYRAGVVAWHGERAALYERLIRDELGPEGCGAFLVWGDPSLYDSTLRILDQVRARGAVDFAHEVIPGISSVQLLAARHRIVLNRVGAPVHVTTGRRLAADDLDARLQDGGSVVVMLDGEGVFGRYADRADVEIHWGAYLGTPHEILIAGRLSEVAERIARTRAEARLAHGWIMDTYLLRRVETAG